MAAERKRLMAEWEEQDAILLALPHEDTDWAPIIDQVQATYRSLIEAMVRHGEKVLLLCPSEPYARRVLGEDLTKETTLIATNYNDTWTRDYGPITVETANGAEALDFGFNGWGLKFASDRDNLANLRLQEKGVFAPAAYRINRDFVLEGGSIDSDGEGSVLTTSRCLCSQNRNGGKTKIELEKILKERLGAERVLWLDHGALEGDDTDSHIDTLARLCPDGKLLYTKCFDDNDSQYEELSQMEAQIKELRRPDGRPYDLRPLPLPDPIHDSDGLRLPATYANYLVTPRAIYMPVYGQIDNDDKAAAVISTVFKDLPMERIDCRPLIMQHGSLHCATMQLGHGTLNPNLHEA